MPDSAAASVRSGSYIKRHKPKHDGRGVCDFDRHPVLSGNGNSDGRVDPSHQARGEIRSVSILAQFLGHLSQRHAYPVAQLLIDRFGSLEQVLMTTPAALTEAWPDDSNLVLSICAARSLVTAALSETVTRSTVDPQAASLHSYLRLKMHGLKHEVLRVIFVDAARGFIAEEIMAIGWADRIEFRIPTILRRVIQLGADGIVLVHNHPSSSCSPSVGDVTATRKIVQMAATLDIKVIDHLIVGGAGVSSMKQAGLF